MATRFPGVVNPRTGRQRLQFNDTVSPIGGGLPPLPSASYTSSYRPPGAMPDPNFGTLRGAGAREAGRALAHDPYMARVGGAFDPRGGGGAGGVAAGGGLPPNVNPDQLRQGLLSGDMAAWNLLQRYPQLGMLLQARSEVGAKQDAFSRATQALDMITQQAQQTIGGQGFPAGAQVPGAGGQPFPGGANVPGAARAAGGGYFGPQQATEQSEREWAQLRAREQTTGQYDRVAREQLQLRDADMQARAAMMEAGDDPYYGVGPPPPGIAGTPGATPSPSWGQRTAPLGAWQTKVTEARDLAEQAKGAGSYYGLGPPPKFTDPTPNERERAAHERQLAAWQAEYARRRETGVAPGAPAPTAAGAPVAGGGYGGGMTQAQAAVAYGGGAGGAGAGAGGAWVGQGTAADYTAGGEVGFQGQAGGGGTPNIQGYFGEPGLPQAVWDARKKRAEGDVRQYYAGLREDLEQRVRHGRLNAAVADRRRNELAEKEKNALMRTFNQLDSERAQMTEEGRQWRSSAILSEYGITAGQQGATSRLRISEAGASSRAAKANQLSRDLATLSDERQRAQWAGDDARVRQLDAQRVQLTRDLQQAQSELQWAQSQSQQGYGAGLAGAQMGLQWEMGQQEVGLAGQRLGLQGAQIGANILTGGAFPTVGEGWTGMGQSLRSAQYSQQLAAMAAQMPRTAGGGGATGVPAMQAWGAPAQPRAGAAPAPVGRAPAQGAASWFASAPAQARPAATFPGQFQQIPAMTPARRKSFAQQWGVSF